MNEIIQSLYQRKSMRVFEERPIPQEMKQAILRAATEAPTAGCQQLYTILDITDQSLKEALAESCDHQPFIATGGKNPPDPAGRRDCGTPAQSRSVPRWGQGRSAVGRGISRQRGYGYGR